MVDSEWVIPSRVRKGTSEAKRSGAERVPALGFTTSNLTIDNSRIKVSRVRKGSGEAEQREAERAPAS